MMHKICGNVPRPFSGLLTGKSQLKEGMPLLSLPPSNGINRVFTTLKWLKIQMIATENTDVLSACRYTAPRKYTQLNDYGLKVHRLLYND